MSRKRAAVFSVVTVLLGLAISAWYFEWIDWPEERGARPRIPGPDETYSNVLPADYVGPQSCMECHQKQHHLWSRHPHRFMNQLASKESIKGDFANHVWTVAPGATVTFSQSGSDFLMTVNRPSKERTKYKVTRTVGSRFVQYYIGLQIEGAEPAGHDVYTTEHRLPFAYWFRMKRWLPVDYFDVGADADEALVDGRPVVKGVDEKPGYIAYRSSCFHCHNTYPHVYRIFRKSLSGFHDAAIDGDFEPLSAAVAKDIAVEPDGEAFAGVAHELDPNKHLVTVGISCESCHFGGREHAKQKKAISFFPTSPHVHVTSKTAEKPFTGNRRNTATSQGTCAQCHSAGGVDKHPNGAHHRNSAESRDLISGGCATQIRCVDCHEPHTPGVPSGGPTNPRHLDTCMRCHEKYSTEEQIEAHSRHSLKSGVDCLECHMPRISQGIDEISRTHRISLPVEQSMISKGAPNACNLCHLEKPVRWTLDELKRGWKQDIQPLAKTPGEFLDAPAGVTWLKSSESITRMVTTDAFSRSHLWKEHIPEVLNSLAEANTTNRSFAMFAVERMLGRPLAVREIDILAGPAQRRRQVELLRGTLEKRK
jgi:Cytochrome c552